MNHSVTQLIRLMLFLVALIGIFTNSSIAKTSGTPLSVEAPAGVEQYQTEDEIPTKVAVGDEHSCAVTSAGRVFCWGSNQYGQLGDKTNINRSTPVDIGLSGIVDITAGSFHTCALTDTGDVKCWGSNNYGQVGDRTNTYRNYPVDVVDLGDTVTKISAGYLFTCGLLGNGKVQCWGENLNGQLGNGSYSNKYVPTFVSGLTDVDSIATGSFHACAGKTNGEVFCWGLNSKGQLGDSTTTRRPLPDKVWDISNADALSASDYFSCALLSTGNAKCWGYNDGGRLGDGTGADRYTPVDVIDLNGASHITSRGSHSFALVGDGIKFWGWNGGLMGDGSTDPHMTAVDVTGMTAGIAFVTTGANHSCAITSYHRILCWGANGAGQLGDGTTTYHSTPVEVSSLGIGSYSITGQIHDDQGNPMEGVVVKSQDGRTALSDQNGTFTFSGVFQGEYTLKPSQTGSRFAPAQLVVKVPTSSVTNFVIRPNTPVPFLDLPFEYEPISGFTKSQTFPLVAAGNNGVGFGKINSWFDHSFPTYDGSPNSNTNNLRRWDGRLFSFGNGIKAQQGVSWYDGHDGLDFSLPQGTPILAAAPGTVDTIRTGGGFCLGNQVTINHGNGYITVYGHLRDIPTVTGTVSADNVIGYSGNTAISPCRSDGPHLHFTVYYDENGNQTWDNEDPVVDPFGWRPYDIGLTDPWGTKSSYLWKYSNTVQSILSPLGSTVQNVSGNIAIQVPENAVSDNRSIEILDAPLPFVPSSTLHAIGTSFVIRMGASTGTSITSSGNKNNALGYQLFEFDQPVTITSKYASENMTHLNESRVSLFRWDELTEQWISLQSTVDVSTDTVITQTTEVGYFSLQAPFLCSADVNEPNDSYDRAVLIDKGETTQVNIFDSQTDEDWYRFEVIKGESYFIGTDHLSDQTDTIISLFDKDGATLLANNDNYGSSKASTIQWMAPSDGSFFIRVTRAPTSAFGCSVNYGVYIRLSQQVFIPVVRRE